MKWFSQLSGYQKNLTITYHPDYNRVYAHEYALARQRFCNSIGRDAYYHYEWSGIESEARTKAEQVISLIIDNDGSY